MPAFERGALVRLRRDLSGDLRVLGIASEGARVPSVALGWFAADGRFRRAVVPADLLEPVQISGEKPSRGETDRPEGSG